jgi:carboxymethylenebutenolidase
MGRNLILRAADSHQLGAYRADPAGPPRGRIVVIQEIFGVNHHIRAVCDRLAGAGYSALAPQIFDRLVRDFETGYSEADIDTGAAVDLLKREGAVAIIGFCMGGTVAYLAAARLGGLTAAVCYYGGMIAKYADEKPRSPTQMHFGALDTHIPMSDVAIIRAKRPECDIQVYAGAGHGFHCDERASYEPASAKIAWDRSLAFLARAFAAGRPSAPPPPPQPPAAIPMAKPPSPPMARPKAKPKPKAKAKKKTKKKVKAKKKAARKSGKKSKKKVKRKKRR